MNSNWKKEWKDKCEETLIHTLFYVFRVFPIQKDKIIISVNLGQGYGDNPKYIAEAIHKKGKEYDIVWLCRNKEDKFPPYIRPVDYRSLRGIYEQVTAKVWIDNRRKPIYVEKRKGQYYIMTWHGAFTGKKVEKEVEDKMPETYIKAAQKDSEMADLFISPSQFDTQRYRESFWYDGEILECEMPRDDILFSITEDEKNAIKERLKIDKNDKVVLYAPTFRAGEDEASLANYRIGWDSLITALQKRFGGKWRGIVRLHPTIAGLSEKLKYPADVINATNYPDMQELLAIADCLISDYSSSVFEFGLIRKPVFLYAADLQDYLGDRGFVLDIHKWPVDVAETDEELADLIGMFDDKKYQKKLDEYYIDRMGKFPLKLGSEEVANRIIEVVEGTYNK